MRVLRSSEGTYWINEYGDIFESVLKWLETALWSWGHWFYQWNPCGWLDYIVSHQFPSPCCDLPTPFPKGKAIFPCSFGGLVEMTDFGFSHMSVHTEAEASKIWCQNCGTDLDFTTAASSCSSHYNWLTDLWVRKMFIVSHEDFDIWEGCIIA